MSGSVVARLSGQLTGMPRWLPVATCYETVMGSFAYGVSSDLSDTDVYGFCLPPKELIFPHLAGEIPGFGTAAPRFEHYQEHHVVEPGRGRTWDLTIYSIVRFFALAMENNPNVIDSLFTPITAILHCNAIGQMVRDRRRDFLHRGAWQKFKGYAYSQLHKMATKTPQPGSKRFADVQRHGYDAKFAYHLVRLISEVEQILLEGDLDLTRNKEQLKAIRRGEWTEPQVREWFERKERALEDLYVRSSLPAVPDEAKLKQLLLDCIEHHYGSISAAIGVAGREHEILQQIKALVEGV